MVSGAQLIVSVRVSRFVVPGTRPVQREIRWVEESHAFVRLRIRERITVIRPREQPTAVVQQQTVAGGTAPSTADDEHLLLRRQHHRPLRTVHVTRSRVQTPFR